MSVNSDFFNTSKEKIKTERRYMSKVFYIFLAAYVLSLSITLICDAFVYAINADYKNITLIQTIISSLNIPLAFVFMWLFCASLPKTKFFPVSKMTGNVFIKLFAVSVFLMVIGSVMGNFVSVIVGNIADKNLENIVSKIVGNMKTYELILLVVVLAPIFEELIFRKLIIDKLSRYGTSFCVIVSGIVFGLYHGNFYQFFYAFALGAVFAYVYCVYGKIIYSIILHAAINTIGSLVPIFLNLGKTQYPTNYQMIYICLYYFTLLAGGQIFFKNLKNIKFYMVRGVLNNPYKALIQSSGFIFTVVFAVLIFAFNIFA